MTISGKREGAGRSKETTKKEHNAFVVKGGSNRLCPLLREEITEQLIPPRQGAI